MSRKLPAAPARVIVRFLMSKGFTLARQKGSHMIFKNQSGRATVVPDHGKEDVPAGTLKDILQAAKLLPEEFMEWLGR